MKLVLCLLVVLSASSIQHVSSIVKYTYQDDGNDGFTVSIGNKMIIQHTKDRPFLYVGRGNTKFMEFRGNFNIQDYTLERIGLQLISRNDSWSGDQLTMAYDTLSTQLIVKFGSEEDHPLTIDIGDIGNSSRVWIQLAAESKESVYGGGEQYSYLNLRGRPYPIWTREQGVGRNKSTLVTFTADHMGGSGGDYHTTYFPQPTFISSRKYYFHHGGSSYAILDFSNPKYHEIFVDGKPGRLYINTGDKYTDLVTSLSEFLGRMPPLPEWIYEGGIIGVQGGTQKMLDYIAYCKKYNINISGVWIQDWAGTIQTSFGKRIFWNWKWNATLYPGLDEEIIRLKKEGIRIMTYINPNLNKDGDLFKIGDEKGYFFKNSKGTTYLQDFGEFQCGTVDLTNPDAYTWYKNEVVKKYAIDLGLGGWMADFGEYLPVDVVAFSKESAKVVHNKFPVLWAKLNREAVEESNQLGEIVYFMRAGYTGTSNYSTLMWAGDQNVDFSYADGLASTIPAALNMGLSGTGITHFDIGGYTTFAPRLVRTEEVLLRSAEAAVFGPVFRSHEGNQPAANKQFYSTPGISMKYARLAKMFTMLKNYSMEVINITATTGIPAQRPLFMQFENDQGSKTVSYQYMYGDDLLVAPVFLSNIQKWNVYLPKDPTPNAKWVNLWTKEEFEGPQNVIVDAPIGRTPVFYKSVSPFVDIFRKIGDTPLVVIVPTKAPTDAPPDNSSDSISCITLLTLFASFIAILSFII